MDGSRPTLASQLATLKDDVRSERNGSGPQSGSRRANKVDPIGTVGKREEARMQESRERRRARRESRDSRNSAEYEAGSGDDGSAHRTPKRRLSVIKGSVSKVGEIETQEEIAMKLMAQNQTPGRSPVGMKPLKGARATTSALVSPIESPREPRRGAGLRPLGDAGRALASEALGGGDIGGAGGGVDDSAGAGASDNPLAGLKNAKLRGLVKKAATKFKGGAEAAQVAGVGTTFHSVVKHASAATGTAVERVKAMLDRFAMLKLRNYNSGEPDDEATSVLTQVTAVLEEAEVQYARTNISYNPAYAEKVFRGLLPKCGKAVRRATEAMVNRSEKDLDLCLKRLPILQERNSLAGNPKDDATESLREAERAVAVASDAEEAYDRSQEETGGVGEFDLADAYIVTTAAAKAALVTCGTNMTSRFEQIIREAYETLNASQKELGQLSSRNEWINTFGGDGDKADREGADAALKAATARVTELDDAAKAMEKGKRAPELADDFMRVAQKVPKVMDRARECVGLRQAAAIAAAKSYMKHARASLDALRSINKDAGKPSDEATTAINKFGDMLRDAEEAAEDMDAEAADGKGAIDPDDDPIADFIDAMEPLRGASDEAFDTMTERAWRFLDAHDKKRKGAVTRVDKASERHKVSPVKAIEKLIADTKKALSQAQKQYQKAEALDNDKVDDVKDEDDLRVLKGLLACADAMKGHVRTADKRLDESIGALETRERDAVKDARGRLEVTRRQLSDVEARHRAVGSPEGEASETLEDAKEAAEQASEASAELDPSDAKALWDMVALVKDCEEAVHDAQDAVMEREEHILEEASSELDSAQNELDGFRARRAAMRKKAEDRRVEEEADSEVAAASAEKVLQKAKWARAAAMSKYAADLPPAALLRGADLDDLSGSRRGSRKGSRRTSRRGSASGTPSAAMSRQGSRGGAGLADSGLGKTTGGLPSPDTVAAFLESMKAVRPALTKVALMAKAAVSASCDMLAYTRQRLKRLSKRLRPTSWFFDDAAAVFEDAREVCDKASDLESRLVVAVRMQEDGKSPQKGKVAPSRPGSSGDDEPTEGKGTDGTDSPAVIKRSDNASITELEDELIATVTKASEAADRSEEAFDRRDNHLMVEAKDIMVQCNEQMKEAERRNRLAGNKKLPPLTQAQEFRLRLKGEAAAGGTPPLEFVDNVGEYKGLVAAAVESVRLRQEEVVENADEDVKRALKKLAELRDHIEETVGLDNADKKTQAELTESDAAIKEAQEGAEGAHDDDQGRQAFKYVDLATAALKKVSKAAEAQAERERIAEMARVNADSRLPQASRTLDDLRESNRTSGNPDDQATRDIDAAWLALNTAETLKKVMQRSPHMLGVAEQFVATVDAATEAVETARASMAARNAEKATEMKKEMQEASVSLKHALNDAALSLKDTRARCDAIGETDTAHSAEVAAGGRSKFGDTFGSAATIQTTSDSPPTTERERDESASERRAAEAAMESTSAAIASAERAQPQFADGAELTRPMLNAFEALVKAAQRAAEDARTSARHWQNGMVKRLRRVVSGARSELDTLVARNRMDYVADYASERLKAAQRTVAAAEDVLDDSAGDGSKDLKVVDINEVSRACTACVDAVRLAKQAMQTRLLTTVRNAQLASATHAGIAAFDESVQRLNAIRARNDKLASDKRVPPRLMEKAEEAIDKAEETRADAERAAAKGNGGGGGADPAAAEADGGEGASRSRTPVEVMSAAETFTTRVSAVVAAVDAAAASISRQDSSNSGESESLTKPSQLHTDPRLAKAAEDLQTTAATWTGLRGRNLGGPRTTAVAVAVGGSAVVAATALQHMVYSSSGTDTDAIVRLYDQSVRGATDAVEAANRALAAAKDKDGGHGSNDVDVLAAAPSLMHGGGSMSHGIGSSGETTDMTRRYQALQSRMRSVEEELAGVRTQCSVNEVLDHELVHSSIQTAATVLAAASVIADVVSGGGAVGRAMLKSAVAVHMVSQFEGAVVAAAEAVDRIRVVVRSLLARSVKVQNSFRAQRDAAAADLDKCEEKLASVVFDWELVSSTKQKRGKVQKGKGQSPAAAEEELVMQATSQAVESAKQAVAAATQALARYDDNTSSSHRSLVDLVVGLCSSVAAAKSEVTAARDAVDDCQAVKSGALPAPKAVDASRKHAKSSVLAASQQLEEAQDVLAAHERALGDLKQSYNSRDPASVDNEAIVRATAAALREAVDSAHKQLEDAEAQLADAAAAKGSAAAGAHLQAQAAVSRSVASAASAALVSSAAASIAQSVGVEAGSVVRVSPQEANAVKHLQSARDKLAAQMERADARPGKGDETDATTLAIEDAVTRSQQALNSAEEARRKVKRTGKAGDSQALNSLTLLVAQAVMSVQALKDTLDEEEEQKAADAQARKMKRNMASVLAGGLRKRDGAAGGAHWKNTATHQGGSKNIVAALVDPHPGRQTPYPEFANSVEAIIALPVLKSRRARSKELAKKEKLQLQTEFISLVARLQKAGRHHKRVIDGLRANNMTSMPPFLGVPLREKLMQATNTLSDVNLALPTPVERALRPVTKAQLLQFEKQVREGAFQVFQFEAAAERVKREMARLALQRKKKEQDIVHHNLEQRQRLLDVADKLEADKRRQFGGHGGPPGPPGPPGVDRWRQLSGRSLMKVQSVNAFQGQGYHRDPSPVRVDAYGRAVEQDYFGKGRPIYRSEGVQPQSVFQQAAAMQKAMSMYQPPHLRGHDNGGAGGPAGGAGGYGAPRGPPGGGGGLGGRHSESMRHPPGGPRRLEMDDREYEPYGARGRDRGGYDDRGYDRGGRGGGYDDDRRSVHSHHSHSVSQSGHSLHEYSSDRDVGGVSFTVPRGTAGDGGAGNGYVRRRRLSRSERRERLRSREGGDPGPDLNASISGVPSVVTGSKVSLAESEGGGSFRSQGSKGSGIRRGGGERGGPPAQVKAAASERRRVTERDFEDEFEYGRDSASPDGGAGFGFDDDFGRDRGRGGGRDHRHSRRSSRDYDRERGRSSRRGSRRYERSPSPDDDDPFGSVHVDRDRGSRVRRGAGRRR